MIKAIETNYRGYRFRSRLEARWAIFFTALGVEWEYEPEGFVVGWYDEGKFSYLPDFKIKFRHGEWYWVEVKGDPDWLSREWNSFVDPMDFGGGLPGMHCCMEGNDWSGSLILLGSIPQKDGEYIGVSVIGHHKGMWHERAALDENGLTHSPGLSCRGKDFPFSTSTFCQPGKVARGPVKRSLWSARSARFEHGESPVLGRV